METVKLAATLREGRGKQAAKQTRREGLVPAILYGHGIDPVPLQVQGRELLRALHTKAGENVLIDLDLTGKKLKESTCLIKDLQHDPVSDRIDHVDFTVIAMNEKIEVAIPLIAKNAEEALGVKAGGVLDIIHHEIEVECLPTAIPEHFEVDIKHLDIGDIIHMKEITLPEGVEVKLDAEEAIIAIHAPRVEEEPTEADPDASSEPEVIEKGKKDDEDAAEASETKKEPKKEAKKE